MRLLRSAWLSPLEFLRFQHFDEWTSLHRSLGFWVMQVESRINSNSTEFVLWIHHQMNSPKTPEQCAKINKVWNF